MSGDAIQTDVSEKKPDTETQEETLSERDLAMQQIDEEIKGSSDVDDGEVSGDEGTVIDDQIASASALQDDVLAGEDLDKKVIVKVDGQDVELSVSEVVRGYQKDSTASKRLEEVAREKQSLAEERRQLEEMKAGLQQKKPGEGADDDSLSIDEVDVDAQVSAAMSALVEGDEETAAQALKDLLMNGRGNQAATQIDPEEIAKTVKLSIENDRKQKEREDDNKKTWADFVDDNPAFGDEESPERVYGDHLYAAKYLPQIEAGELSYREALDKTAEDVAARFETKAQPQNTTSEKTERKRQLDSIPVAGSARAQQVKQPEESTEDVISEMAQSRGLPG